MGDIAMVANGGHFGLWLVGQGVSEGVEGLCCNGVRELVRYQEGYSE